MGPALGRRPSDTLRWMSEAEQGEARRIATLDDDDRVWLEAHLVEYRELLITFEIIDTSDARARGGHQPSGASGRRMVQRT